MIWDVLIFYNDNLVGVICLVLIYNVYREISNISCTQSQNLNDSHLVLHLSLPNLLKPGVKAPTTS